MNNNEQGNQINNVEAQQNQERLSVLHKSFVGASIITLILYFIFYLPGLIVNIMYLKEANRIKKITGRTPTGQGCLSFLLFLGLLPIIIWILIIIAAS